MSERFGTLIVTGGSRGIGAAVSRIAAARGYAVAVNYQRDQAAANAVVEEIQRKGGRATAIQADVAVEQDVLRLFDCAEKLLGTLCALVNNAGITGGFAREAVRRLSTKHGGSGGAIVNISSRAAQLGSPGEWVHYAASKAALDALTIGLGREVTTEGIRVNAVAPGLVDTDIHAANGDPGRLARLAPTIPMGRAGTAEEVAEGVLWLL